MYILKNYNNILDSIQSLSTTTSLIVVTKGQLFEKIDIIIKSNHFDFGENRVQEAIIKWKDKIIIYPKLKLSQNLYDAVLHYNSTSFNLSTDGKIDNEIAHTMERLWGRIFTHSG